MRLDEEGWTRSEGRLGRSNSIILLTHITNNLLFVASLIALLNPFRDSLRSSQHPYGSGGRHRSPKGHEAVEGRAIWPRRRCCLV